MLVPVLVTLAVKTHPEWLTDLTYGAGFDEPWRAFTGTLVYTAAIQLGRALLDPGAAVGALRDVRGHLGATALADEVEVWTAAHEGEPSLR